MKIVYDGGRHGHMSSDMLYHYVEALDRDNRGLIEIEEISDTAAQTIAAQWHSPSRPNTTLLSTMGKVSDEMNILDFASLDEWDRATEIDQLCLDYLESYILSKQDDN